MYRLFALIVLVALSACRDDIYVRNGVTGGDRFHISPQQLLAEDPVQQSWIAYSLAKSVCQLELDDDNPARANSFGCEFSSRLHLLDEWQQQRTLTPGIRDDYLDTLAMVRDEAFLDEYVVYFFGKKNWIVPAEIEQSAFGKWRRKHLRGHKTDTRVIGSWSFRRKQK